MNNIFCEECNDFVKYIKKPALLFNEDLNVNYNGTECFCEKCGSQVYPNDVEIENLKQANINYENNKIQPEQIEELLKKYNIGATVLSKLLGWGEVTITRYKNGAMPSTNYSKKLLQLLNDPSVMYNLLEANKNDLPTATYRKSLAAIKSELSKIPNLNNNISSNDIDLIAQYILSKVTLTPKALQKVLYYIQGFYNAFTNDWLFTTKPQAWIHGPVYDSIYYKYRDFKHNPIVIDIDENILLKVPDYTKSLIDNVIRYYGCYTGDTLENLTHNEQPWLNARIGLSTQQASQNEISLEDISQYFKAIKDKYHMITPNDIKDYIIDQIYNS